MINLESLTKRYDAFVRTRQAATHSYVGYDGKITGLRSRRRDLLSGNAQHEPDNDQSGSLGRETGHGS